MNLYRIVAVEMTILGALPRAAHTERRGGVVKGPAELPAPNAVPFRGDDPKTRGTGVIRAAYLRQSAGDLRTLVNPEAIAVIKPTRLVSPFE